MLIDFHDLRADIVVRIGGEPFFGWVGRDDKRFRAALRQQAALAGVAVGRLTVRVVREVAA